MNHKEVGRTRIKHGKSKLAVLVGALALTLEFTALSAPTITAQPQSQTVWAGTNITFAVTATGTAPLGYQWRKGGAELTDGGNVSGAATAALALANVRLTDAGNYDVVVTDASGSVSSQVAVLTVSLPPGTELGREWTRIWGSASDDLGWSVAADNAGNAYVVGDTAGALDGQTNLGGLDVFLTKYSASGVKVWTRQWGSTADDNNAQVVVDNAGNIYVTGSTRGAMDGQSTYGDWDAFLSKFSPEGARLWTRVWGSGQHEHPLAITVDCSNRVCIVGYTGGTFDGQPKAGPGTDDSFLTVFSEDGNRLWSRIWGSNADDLAGGVASDAAGNLYVGGSSRGPIDGQPHQGDFDYYLSKFSPDGTRLWTRMGGSSAIDFGYKVALDPVGLIYMSGYTQGAFDGQTNVGGYDGFLVQYLPDGTRGWTRLWGSPVNDIPYDLGVDNTGSILVSGYTEGAFDGQGNQGATDLFLTRFFPDGTRNRTCLWGSATNDVGGGIALVNGGALFVAGCTAGAFDGQTNAGGQDMFLTRWVPQATARIVSQPTNQTVIAGATASFQVVASDSAPLSYQWFFDQTNLLAGATNAALTLTNAQSANAGSYNVVVSHNCSSVTSQVAILRVLMTTPSVHYVDGGSANPVSPFGSWGTAARTIQDAVAVAVDGDTVLVTNGVYLLDNQITITNGITVTSVNGPRVTVVDGGYSRPDADLHAGARQPGWSGDQWEQRGVHVDAELCRIGEHQPDHGEGNG